MPSVPMPCSTETWWWSPGPQEQQYSEVHVPDTRVAVAAAKIRGACSIVYNITTLKKNPNRVMKRSSFSLSCGRDRVISCEKFTGARPKVVSTQHLPEEKYSTNLLSGL